MYCKFWKLLVPAPNWNKFALNFCFCFELTGTSLLQLLHTILSNLIFFFSLIPNLSYRLYHVCVCVYGWLLSVAFTIVLLPLFSFVLLVCWLDGQSLDIFLFYLFYWMHFTLSLSLISAQDGDDDNEY